MSSESKAAVTGNMKTIIIIAAAALLLVGGYFGFQEFVTKPKNDKAASAMMYVERFFENQQFEEVINGDGQNRGALAIINEFGGTKVGNLARYYAGMSFLHKGEFEQAVKYLEQYKTSAGTSLEALANGAIGDAYLELGNEEKALASYKKAIASKDDFATPLFLFKTAMTMDEGSQQEEIINYLLQIKNDYPMSAQAEQVEKYLAYFGHVE